MPKVSLILPTYNAAQYLPESILSILSQTFQDHELIIIDDGSTDNTQKVVQQYLSCPKIIYIRKERGGPASARNRGLQVASGEYIAFLDADDIYAKSKLEKQVYILDNHPSIDIVYTSEKFFYNNTNKLFASPYAKISGDLFIFLIRDNFITTPTIMIRRSSLGKIIFDESQETIAHEDWDFLLKLAYYGKKFFCLDEDLTFIRLHAGSFSAAERQSFMLTNKNVHKRALALWNDFKNGINLKSRKGFINLVRFISLKIQASMLNFPNAPRFNKPYLERPTK